VQPVYALAARMSAVGRAGRAEDAEEAAEAGQPRPARLGGRCRALPAVCGRPGSAQEAPREVGARAVVVGGWFLHASGSFSGPRWTQETLLSVPNLISDNIDWI